MPDLVPCHEHRHPDMACVECIKATDAWNRANYRQRAEQAIDQFLDEPIRDLESDRPNPSSEGAAVHRLMVAVERLLDSDDRHRIDMALRVELEEALNGI